MSNVQIKMGADFFRLVSELKKFEVLVAIVTFNLALALTPSVTPANTQNITHASTQKI